MPPEEPAKRDRGSCCARAAEGAAGIFGASLEAQISAPLQTSIDTILTVNESIWLDLEEQDTRLVSIAEQLSSTVVNFTQKTHKFWDDAIRAPLEAESRFNLSRFPEFVGTAVASITAAKKSEATEKAREIQEHINHALKLRPPMQTATTTGAVVSFDEGGRTRVVLP